MPTSTALAKRPAPSDLGLMAPPPPPKRIKRPPNVLDEDTYTSALSHIIARDFFPGLLETESTKDYLDALDAGDDEWIDEAEKRVREVLNTPQGHRGRRGVSMTPIPRDLEQTPRAGSTWAGATPIRTRDASMTPAHFDPAHEQTPTTAKPDYTSLSLSDFQAKYTSEDNASFDTVLDTQNAKKREKYGWLWNNNRLPSARQIAQAAHHRKLLKQSEHKQEARYAVQEDSSTALTLRPSADQDDRPAGITQIRPYNPRNTLMFAPDSDVSDPQPHLTSTHEAAQQASRAPPKAVSYASTRLPQSALPESETDSGAPTSPSLSAIDAAIAGHPRHRSISTAAPSIAPSDAGYSGGDTPRVNGYAFVDAEPTPSEMAEPPVPSPETASTRKTRDRNELLQHLLGINAAGEDGGSAAPNPFSLQEKSKREDLHHRMVYKQAAAKRKPVGRLEALRGDATGKTPTPRFMSSPVVGGKTPGAAATRQRQELGSLTPAAQSLYQSVGRTPVTRSSRFGSTNGVSGGGWTPKTLAGVKARGQ